VYAEHPEEKEMTDEVQVALLEAKQVDDVAHQYPGPPAHEVHEVYAGYVPQFEGEPIRPYAQVEPEVTHEPVVELAGHQYPVDKLAQASQFV
jgi:hypothetical protein